ncbi:MAG TPA: hypothetical protein VKC60_14295, partial [Opitutaceae bacterium]|nr:hypothetical protein [Opitutaceae bacterium]
EPKVGNTWAPEITYDDGAHHFLIFWASTIPGRFPETDESGRTDAKRPILNHRIYSTTTKDFKTFTPTRLHYDAGFNVIDATLQKNGNEWLMFVKDETLNPAPEKNVRLVHAKTPDGPFSPRSAPITGSYWAEGPTSIKIGDFWYVYFDKYRDHKFGVVRSRDLEHWEDISDQLKMPSETRHGTVFRAPREIVDNLKR